MNRIVRQLTCIVLILAATVCASAQERALSPRLERTDWSSDVRAGLNDLLAAYGHDSPNYAARPYVVFDFDNTCSIFDVEEQLMIYQLETMRFAIAPNELANVLSTDLSDLNADLSEYGYFHGTYSGLIDDITGAYSRLWDRYGPFTAQGVADERQEALHNDPNWKEFATKMRVMYDLVCDVEPKSVAYPWILYWFVGMTDEEIYTTTRLSCRKYGAVNTSAVVWESPRELESKVGVVSYKWTSGTGVTANTRELWSALQANGIDVWVCSASGVPQIRAAVDEWGLHEYCKGLLAMTTKVDDEGKCLPAYDYDSGRGYYARPNGEWTKMERVEGVQTEGVGKVLAIQNAIAPEYDGRGPIAGFMDSSGDFNFCTEFKSLKLVVCFNRATRKITEGGGLIAEIATYEKETLGYDLAKATAANDVLYLLQGRDENGKRALRDSSATLRLGASDETLFCNDDVYAQLRYFVDKKLTVAEALNTFALKRDAKENPFGVKSGFLNEYNGYRSR